jgi:hypothetical protein
MLLAARNYPGGYDWPYTTISSLVYAERNPSGFLWAPALPWVSPAWRAREVPVWLSFAFWEWVTCASLSLDPKLLSRTAFAGPR